MELCLTIDFHCNSVQGELSGFFLYNYVTFALLQLSGNEEAIRHSSADHWLLTFGSVTYILYIMC